MKRRVASRIPCGAWRGAGARALLEAVGAVEAGLREGSGQAARDLAGPIAAVNVELDRLLDIVGKDGGIAPPA
ncbi:MAG: hypothetical protein IPM70_07095 [Proteobacteria bacterium]|nr:hypothetical protein [Pseudomonadota bacterium]